MDKEFDMPLGKFVNNTLDLFRQSGARSNFHPFCRWTIELKESREYTFTVIRKSSNFEDIRITIKKKLGPTYYDSKMLTN
mmetsp:Transcript_3367/g.4145  ORF Transcript_3367/g.4145 Transcript_3367/m.4145 type:complete len:80 (+) Transcript_3367:289-528(+)